MIEAVFRKLGVEHERILRLSKEGGWIALGQAAKVTGALVLVRVLTENLAPEQYGQLALSLTLVGLVSQVLMSGFVAGIPRFYSIATEKDDLRGYISDSIKLTGLGTLVVIAVGGLTIILFSTTGYSQWSVLAGAVLLFALLSAYNNSLNGLQNAARQRIIVAIHSGLFEWLKILLIMSAAVIWELSITLVIVSYIAASLLTIISQLMLLKKSVLKRRINEKRRQYWRKQMLAYSWPFAVWGIFTWVSQISDRWALKVFSSTEDVGQYAVLFQLGYTPVIMVSTMLLTFIAPILYGRAGDSTDRIRVLDISYITRRLIHIFTILLALIVSAVWLAHDWIFYLLVAEDYRGVSYLLPWVVLAAGIFAIGEVQAVKLTSEMRTREILAPKIVAAIIGILLHIGGAALAGLHGIIISLIIFSIIYTVWMISLRTPEQSA